jgi:DNA-binding NarL/FixJ family response regulator
VRVPQLSLIEERIVLLLADGWSRIEVAADVGLDERTVAWHIAQATRKLESASTLHDRVRRAVANPPSHGARDRRHERTIQ